MKPVVIQPTDEIYKLAYAVSQAVEQFMLNKNTKPTKVFFNNQDFKIDGEVEIVGYKVRATNLVPQGQVIVMDDTPFTIYDNL